MKLSTEADVEQLFKTVSRTAVQNLSPSKCRADIVTPTETDRDFDDIDNYSESDQEFRLEQDKNCIKEQSVLNQGPDNFNKGNNNFSQGTDFKTQGNCIEVEVNDRHDESDILCPVMDIISQENDIKEQRSGILSQGIEILSQGNDIKVQETEIEYQNGDNASNNTENGIDKSFFEQKSRSDPLHDFSEVDLSS